MARQPLKPTRHGKHASPRRQLLGTPEQFAAWDAAAEAAGLTWAEWARLALDAAARRQGRP